MTAFIHGRMAYLETIPGEPQETYLAREIAQLREAMKQHPEDELYLLQRLLIFVSLIDAEEAILLAERMLEIDTEKEFIDDTYIVLARSYADKKEIEKAMDYFRKGHEINPYCEEYITGWAGLYADKFDFENAIKIYELLDNDKIRYGKENSFRNRAAMYHNLKQFDTALDFYNKALLLNPDDKDGCISENIAKTLLLKTQYKESIEWFKKALEKNPASGDSHFGMGICYQEQEDYYRAMHHYTETLKLKPGFTNALNNIAAIAINHDGQLKEGIELLEKAIETAEDKNTLSIIYMNLSRVYNKISDYDKADYYKTLYMKSFGFDIDFTREEDDEME